LKLDKIIGTLKTLTMQSFAAFIPLLIILSVGTYIIYRTNRTKLIGLSSGKRIEKIALYAIYMFLGCVAFTICSIVIQKLFK